MSRKQSAPVKLPLWTYLGGETIEGNDASQSATLPADAKIVMIVASGGDVSYALNSVSAVALSPGFVPQNERIIEGPLTNLNNLQILAATGTDAHIQYYVENTGR